MMTTALTLYESRKLDILGSRNATERDFAGVIEILSKGDDFGDALRDWDLDPPAVSNHRVLS